MCPCRNVAVSSSQIRKWRSTPFGRRGEIIVNELGYVGVFVTGELDQQIDRRR